MANIKELNEAFAAWKSSPEMEKDSLLAPLVLLMRELAESICWQRISDHQSDFPEVVSAAVWRAISNAGKFRGASQFSVWFYRIVTNECNRLLASHVRRGVEIPIDDDSTETLDGIGVVDSTDAAIYMMQIFDELEPEDAELLRLHAIGYSTKEIGERMKLGVSAVDTRWLRLKEKMRDAESA